MCKIIGLENLLEINCWGRVCVCVTRRLSATYCSGAAKRRCLYVQLPDTRNASKYLEQATGQT